MSFNHSNGLLKADVFNFFLKLIRQGCRALCNYSIVVATKLMVALMSAERKPTETLTLHQLLPGVAKRRRSAQLSALRTVCHQSLAHTYASIEDANGRSVRHCLLLVWIHVEARTIVVAVFLHQHQRGLNGFTWCGLRRERLWLENSWSCTSLVRVRELL